VLIPLATDRPNRRTPVVTQTLVALNLGVFIAMTLTQRVQGKVTLSNAPGGGARVEITLPRTGLEIED
jgi:signal transduction histidine kinase